MALPTPTLIGGGELLAGPVDQILRILTSVDDEAIALRTLTVVADNAFLKESGRASMVMVGANRGVERRIP